jgi:nitrate/TMAO reductase-like tetraheme cytochrome c subunit
MPSILQTGLGLFVVVTAMLIFAVTHQPRLLRRTSGKAMAFLALFLLPLVVTGLGAAAHLDQAKSTEFCISCHVMEPYGKSLHYEDQDYLPAAHFQNARVPRDHACYTCHTTYTMFGGVKAKLGGLKHVWIYYTGQTPDKIELYEPYQNRECLHCHGEARSFIEGGLHADMQDELFSNETSCLECHEFTHDAAEADAHEMWEAPHGE